MPKTYASQKFLSLLAPSLIAMIGEYLLLLSDSLIAGNLLGEDALLSITLVTPFFSFAVFCGMAISIGTNITFSHEVGKGHRDQASLYFSQGLILIIGTGVLLTAAYLGLYAAVPNIFGTSEEINVYIRDYLWYISLLPVPLLLNILLFDIILTEGGENLCTISSVVQLVSNIGLSLFLCQRIGIGGIGLGTLISNIITAFLLASFFLRKSNQIVFQWFLNARAVLRVVSYSLTDAGRFLFLGATQMIMSIFLLHRFGTDAVVIFTVVISLLTLLIACFDNLGESIMPLVRVYRSEGSQRGVMKTMRAANVAALTESLLVTAALLILADFIPTLFGISTTELIEQTGRAVRIVALSCPVVAFIMLYTSYYLYIDRILLSLAVTGAYMLAFPVVLGVGLGIILGLDGVWGALAASSVLAFLFCALWAYKSKQGAFPLMLNVGVMERELSYDVPKTRSGIMDLVYKVEHDLHARGVDDRRIFKIMLMIEETEMFAIEKTEEPGSVIECTLFLEDEITLILRDSGKEQFIMSEDAELASFTGYVYTRLLTAQQEKRYILTGGKNRVIYKF